MFRSGAEKRIVREADRIVSMKENIDALSWGRVLALGKELQRAHPHGAEAALARELIGIAQSNLSLTSRLGIDPHPADEQIMASGVEMVEGGLAEAALLTHHQVSSRDDAAGGAERPFLPNAAVGEAVRKGDAGEMSDVDGDPGLGVCRSVGFEGVFDFRLDFDPDEGVAVNQSMPGQCAEASHGLDEGASALTQEPSCPVADAMRQTAGGQDGSFAEAKLARFCSLYESRDGGLCLFEDDQGHLVAVDASKLA